MKTRRKARFSVATFALVFLLLGLGSTVAQNTKRAVRGQVVTPSGAPISGAIVYLTDTQTTTVVSYITQQDGHYRFEHLSPYNDYQVVAKVGGKKSDTRIISSFDNRSIFHILLTIDTGK